MRRRCQGSPKGNAKEGMVSQRKARDGKATNERDGGNRENIVNNASTTTMWLTSEEFGFKKERESIQDH